MPSGPRGVVRLLSLDDVVTAVGIANDDPRAGAVIRTAAAVGAGAARPPATTAASWVPIGGEKLLTDLLTDGPSEGVIHRILHHSAGRETPGQRYFPA